MKGGFVLSIDYESGWGSRDKRSPASDEGALSRERDTIRQMLDMFCRFRISATWAVVGHLMLPRAERTNGVLHPDMPRPDSALKAGDWYDGVPAGDCCSQPFFYAPDMIDAILSCPVPQELACHTFSHVVMDPTLCSRQVAVAEFGKCRELAAGLGQPMTSVVFPRNFVGHLDVLSELGFRCYRGQNCEWYWALVRPNAPAPRTRLARYARRLLMAIQTPMRLLDEALAIRPPLPPARKVDSLWEIPHSMFFAGASGSTRWVPARRRVVKAVRGLEAAASRGRLFSLWTHPQNISGNPGRLLPALEQICRTAAETRDTGRIDIVTMGQAAELLDRGQRPEWTA